MSNETDLEDPSARMQRLLAETFNADDRPATKEDIAKLYAVIVHLRDIVMTHAGILATMPLNSEQIDRFNESQMPLHKFQEAIGDGLIKLLGDKEISAHD